jgi:hypothetical protein
LQVIAIIGERSRKAQPIPVERRDAEPGCAGHAAHDVGGKAGRALVRGEHEVDAALAHRFHQRQHIAARNAEAAGDPARLQRRDNQIGIVHGDNRGWRGDDRAC